MGKVEKQSTVWQSNSMGCFDGLKLKFNNFVIDQTINYLGNNFSEAMVISPNLCVSMCGLLVTV